MEHGHGEFLSSVAIRSRRGSRCTFSGRPDPKTLAGTTAAAHRQQGCQKEVRRGSRALGGATTGPARRPSGLGRKRKLFCSYREERERQHGRAGQLLPVFRGRRTKPFFSPDPRTLCQAKPLVGSFPALLAPGGVVIRAAQSPLRRGPE